MRASVPAALAILLAMTLTAQADRPDPSQKGRTSEAAASAANFANPSGPPPFSSRAGDAGRTTASIAGGVESRSKVGVDARLAMRRAKFMPIARAVKPAALPTSLVDAVITKESRYVPTVRGAVGEVGLMQIRPSTAREIARKHGMTEAAALSPASFEKWLEEPRNNLKLGMIYLEMCHDRAGGNVPATIGCYNAGPGNMWHWKGIRITRKYVAFVNKHMKSVVN